MREWLDALVAVLLAPTCAACGQLLLHPTRGCICPFCWASIVRLTVPLCDGCGDSLPTDTPVRLCPHCIRASTVVTRARAIGSYAGSLRDVVHALKYDGRRSVAAPLAALMREAAPEIVAACEVTVPVPLHPARRRERGFTRAGDLAWHLGLPLVHALRRIRRTTTQTALPAPERHANVAGAFTVTRRGRQLRGRAVLLVDDVRTTGATLDACAEALLNAGVREVCAVTAARVAPPGS